MILKQFNITLKRIEESDIEVVRQGRNKKFVRKNHFYQEIITKEQQKDWFKSIDNKHNYYFLIQYKEEDVGVIYANNVNESLLTTDCGIFIFNEQYLSSKIPILAFYTYYYFFFTKVGLKNVYGIVKKDNFPCLKLNEFLGVENQLVDGKFYKAIHSADKFSARNVQLEKIMQKISKTNHELQMDIRPSEKQMKQINLLANIE